MLFRNVFRGVYIRGEIIKPFHGCRNINAIYEDSTLQSLYSSEVICVGGLIECESGEIIKFS